MLSMLSLLLFDQLLNQVNIYVAKEHVHHYIKQNG